MKKMYELFSHYVLVKDNSIEDVFSVFKHYELDEETKLVDLSYITEIYLNDKDVINIGFFKDGTKIAFNSSNNKYEIINDEELEQLKKNLLDEVKEMNEEKLTTFNETLIDVNGRIKKIFFDGKNEFENLSDLLRSNFKDHGEFYEKIFNITREEAEEAGWSPDSDMFLADLSTGWRNFLRSKGKIKKNVIITNVFLKDEIKKLMDNFKE